jgi:hypothetical protein
MPDPVTAAVVGGGVVSAKMQSDAARDAAEMQVAGGDRALAESRRTYEQGREDARPYRETGYTALQDITKRMPLFTSQFGDEQMAQYLDPSMEFRRKLGEQTTARMLNVGGGAISGNTLRGLEDYGQNLASTEYGNAFNRFQNERNNIYNTLANIAGMGQGAVNTGVQAGTNFGGQQASIITGQAAAQAAGGVGAANAYSGALGNIGNYAMLNSFLGKQAPGTAVQQTGQSSSGLFPMPSTQSASPYYSTPQNPSFSFSAP